MADFSIGFGIGMVVILLLRFTVYPIFKDFGEDLSDWE